MNTKLRDLIRQRLKEKNMDQVELADQVGLTAPEISRIISGERGTSLDNLLAIADALQIKRAYFLQVAAGSLPDPGKDEWVEDISHKITLLPKGQRDFVSVVINALMEGVDSEPRRTRHQ